MAIDIDLLVPLANNPRVGNVDAIMASYSEFGQVKPIVIKANGDGTSTVIAGNHQLEAAKRLGWTEIAAVELSGDDARAIAFALADNRTMELGHTDPELLNVMLADITDIYPELMDDLGWDDFEMAAMSEQIKRLSANDILSDGYVPPQIVNPFIPNEDKSPTIKPIEQVDVATAVQVGASWSISRCKSGCTVHTHI
jgi:ParB-like chromosome segregation protein Spo0J